MTAAPKVAGYLRISVDDTRRALRRDREMSKGDAVNAAIERQREDCLAALQDMGWDGPVEWYVDRATSAYNEAVIRAEFERLLVDLAAGRVTHVIVYHPDRLARLQLDLERMLRIYRREAKTAKFATATGEIDPRDEHGARRLRWEVDSANAQSVATARRVARKHRANALEGVPVGGTRPFGWDKVTEDGKRAQQIINIDEAERIRKAVADVLGGKPLASVVVEWQRDGILTTRGNRWTRASLLKTLTNPRLAGYSARNVTSTDDTGKTTTRLEIVRDRDGSPVMGQWDPILTVEEWEAVAAALMVKRPRPGTGGTATKYLLSGVARCGVCQRPLRGIARSRVKGPSTYAYLCQSRSAGGCGGISRHGPKTDEYVTAALLAKMRLEFEAAAQTVEVAPWEGASELMEAAESVRLICEALGQGKATAALINALAAQEDRVRRLERERGAYLAAKAKAEAVPVSLTREQFDALPFPTRRRYVEDRLAAVIVKPVPAEARHRGRFDPSLLEPVWR